MELVIAQVERCVDWLEGFKINVYFFLFAFLSDNGTTIHHQTRRGNPRVQLEPMLDGGNGAQNGQTIYTRFDV
jgi:hypothetical protein